MDSAPGDLAAAQANLAQAHRDWQQAIAELRSIWEELAGPEIIRYKGLLRDAELALINLHGVVASQQQQGYIISDTELGEIGFTFITHLNNRRQLVLALDAGRVQADAEISTKEQSLRVLVKALRGQGMSCPELWPA
ncbi:MAG: hypothetical protein V1826_03060 [bacterium]